MGKSDLVLIIRYTSSANTKSPLHRWFHSFCRPSFCGTGKGLLWQATVIEPGCERALYVEAGIVAFVLRVAGCEKVGID
jgi:hypothetical protein